MNALQKQINKVDAYQQRHRLPGFIYAVIKKYGDDGAGYWAALLTYYGFLALFPLLMVLTTVAHSVLGSHPDLEQTVLSGVTDYFPILGSQLSDHIHGLKSNGLALFAGIVFSIYGARGVAEVFRRGLRKVWGMESKKTDGFPKELIRSLAIIVIGGLGFLSASIIASLAAAAGHGWGFRLASVGINLFILFWLFNFLIYASLPKHVAFKDTRLGAACAAIGLVILQLLGGYILAQHLKRLDALYSTFAITLGLLFWLYIQSQIIYYANEIAVVSSKKLWPRKFSE
jgi:YihY family inner membrane protein